MTALFVASTVAWARMGNAQLRSNWAYGQENASQSIARQIFNGVCVGVLGLTGFECTQSSQNRAAEYPADPLFVRL